MRRKSREADLELAALRAREVLVDDDLRRRVALPDRQRRVAGADRCRGLGLVGGPLTAGEDHQPRDHRGDQRQSADDVRQHGAACGRCLRVGIADCLGGHWPSRCLSVSASWLGDPTSGLPSYSTVGVPWTSASRRRLVGGVDERLVGLLHRVEDRGLLHPRLLGEIGQVVDAGLVRVGLVGLVLVEQVVELQRLLRRALLEHGGPGRQRLGRVVVLQQVEGPVLDDRGALLGRITERGAGGRLELAAVGAQEVLVDDHLRRLRVGAEHQRLAVGTRAHLAGAGGGLGGRASPIADQHARGDDHGRAPPARPPSG